MVAKLIPIILILIAGIFLGKVTPNLSMVPQDGTPVTFSNMVSMIAFSVVATLWAYDGWANVSAVGEEIKDPHKNLPRALMAGVGMVTAIYVLFNFSIFRVLEPGKISSLVESGDYYLGTAAAKQTLGYVGGVAVLLAMIFSMLSSMNGMIITYPRMTYAIAEDGHFFSLFGKLHPTHKVPGNALIVQAIISCIFVIFRSLSSLTTLVTFSGLLWNFLVAVGVIVLRYRMPNAERPYKIRLYPYLVIVASLAFFGLIVNQIITKPETVSIGLIVPVVAVLVYFIFDQRLKKTVQ
jgi:APA family basic amino acid/polyamine antiporter